MIPLQGLQWKRPKDETVFATIALMPMVTQSQLGRHQITINLIVLNLSTGKLETVAPDDGVFIQPN